MNDETTNRLRLALGEMVRILGASMMLTGARMGLLFGRYPFAGGRRP